MIRLVVNKLRIGFVLLNCSIWFVDFALIAIGETEARAYRRPPNSRIFMRHWIALDLAETG
jgi:hypothetical protein